MTKWSGFVDWVARARQLISPRDFLWLTPPGALAIMAGFASGTRQAESSAAGTPAPPPTKDQPPDLSLRDPELVELAHDLFRAIGRYYFRLEIQGVEHIPASGPVM